MSANLKAVENSLQKKSSGASAGDELRTRHSSELVIGLSGPVGCGIEIVADELSKALEERGYLVVRIKVSSHFPDIAQRLGIDGAAALRTATGFARYDSFQSIGNELRKRLGDDLAGQLVAVEIFTDRANKNPDVEIDKLKPGRVAYLVDQLKHPSEARLLREIYGDLFFLVGVLCGYRRRLQNLSASMDEGLAAKLMTRDKAEADANGQQLDKTLQLSDYFIRNSHSNTIKLSGSLKRFLDLVHGGNGITPTRKESGMYEAFSASLNSACLSRQVGAAILDSAGNLLSTGCNDVPRSGGGLYKEEHKPGGDHRCVFFEGGRCFNQQRKENLKNDVAEILKREGLTDVESERIATMIRAETGLKDLIEFSRSVHAEMDAIVSLARTGGKATDGAILFTTTYPCHNCARHIIAAGIRAVYFIEPYDKSLAEKLHYDAIDHEPENEPDFGTSSDRTRVAFIHFEGVAPNRYKDLFLASKSRKDANGRPIHAQAVPEKKIPEFLDNYRELEGLIFKRLRNAGVVDIFQGE